MSFKYSYSNTVLLDLVIFANLLQNKVSSVTFQSGQNTEELYKIRTVEVESRATGWISCTILGWFWYCSSNIQSYYYIFKTKLCTDNVTPFILVKVMSNLCCLLKQ